MNCYGKSQHSAAAFTLIEMLVVVAIIAILLTVGAIGIAGVGGKGVTSGVATVEALFDEARSTAVARNLRACVLVAKSLDNNHGDDLRRIIVAYEETDPATGAPANPSNPNPKWVISSRGLVLPDQVYFSEVLSKKDHQSGGDAPDVITLSDVKSNYVGEYFIYRFNSEGICLTPGASVVLGRGMRNPNKSSVEAPPRITASGKKDFGGFVIWRNGGTSTFRSPTQISDNLPELPPKGVPTF
jgi:prepilin-type N-terminal cleavage/methylation domain-containing protein